MVNVIKAFIFYNLGFNPPSTNENHTRMLGQYVIKAQRKRSTKTSDIHKRQPRIFYKRPLTTSPTIETISLINKCWTGGSETRTRKPKINDEITKTKIIVTVPKSKK